MSHSPTLLQDIATVFADQLHLDVPSPDTDLFAEGVMDSLALVQLIVALEKAFKVTISLTEVELESLSTVNGIAELLTRLGARAKIREFVA